MRNKANVYFGLYIYIVFTVLFNWRNNLYK